MERHVHDGITLLATIPGLASDGDAVRAALAELRPSQLALGIPPEDLYGLAALAQSADPESLMPGPESGTFDIGGAPGLEGIHGVGHGEVTEDEDSGPFAGLDAAPTRLLQLLERFGPVRLPSPDLEAAYAWAQHAGLSPETIDMDDETHADVFVAANRLIDIIRAGRHNGKLLKATFDDAKDAAQLVRAFDAFQNKLPSLGAVETARERHMAKRLRELADNGPLCAVVPLARADGILRHLDAGEEL